MDCSSTLDALDNCFSELIDECKKDIIHFAQTGEFIPFAQTGAFLNDTVNSSSDHSSFFVHSFPATYHLALLMVCTFHSSLDMHDVAHTMMISDIATSAWLIDFCHKAI